MLYKECRRGIMHNLSWLLVLWYYKSLTVSTLIWDSVKKPVLGGMRKVSVVRCRWAATVDRRFLTFFFSDLERNCASGAKKKTRYLKIQNGVLNWPVLFIKCRYCTAVLYCTVTWLYFNRFWVHVLESLLCCKLCVTARCVVSFSFIFTALHVIACGFCL